MVSTYAKIDQNVTSYAVSVTRLDTLAGMLTLLTLHVR